MSLERFSRWSIIARLTFLAVMLLAILVASNVYLSRKLSDNSQALAESGQFIGALGAAYQATTAFGNLKYWLTDLAVSLLVRSEQQAYEAADALEEQLAKLESYAPDEVAAVRADAEELIGQAMLAVDAYTEGERVLGNSLMAVARGHISDADQRLAGLVAQLEAAAATDRATALAGAEDAVDLAVMTAVGATFMGLLLTVVVVRSITVPLQRLTGAMSAITAGRLDVPVPAAGRDEIGQMASTLEMFRESQLERQRLAAERERAEAERQRAQTQLIEAIESISEGFVLYDRDDVLVICNERYRQLYGGLEVTPAPGVRYDEVLRAAARQGLIPQARDQVEAWIAKRVRQHRAPGPPHEQYRTSGQWLRISERKTQDGGVVGVFSDITALKTREALLREEQERTAAANRLIMESLRYASRIQSAILPHAEGMEAIGADRFLIWEPRDIVGGDFFWFRPVQGGYLVLVGDCTGHGVPGAFMTLIATGVLDRLVQAEAGRGPGRLLARLHRDLQSLLGQDDSAEGTTDDGLEAGLCLVQESERKVVFAGARFSLWQAKDGAVEEVKGDRAGLGYRRVSASIRFNDVALDLERGLDLYMTTDGLIDQVGGPRRRSFGKRRFARFLAEQHERPMQEQAAALKSTFASFQGRERRRDDITILGLTPLAA